MKQPEITVHIPAQSAPALPLHVQMAHVLTMACRACGCVMVRGTQCPRCGAWCR